MLNTKKILTGLGIIIVFFGVMTGSFVLADADTVQFNENTNIYLWGIPLTLIVQSGSQVASTTVYATYISFEMESGSTVTVRSNDKRTLISSSGEVSSCGSNYSSITVSAGSSVTITITPTTSVCGGVTGGGPVITTPIVPVEPEEEEITKELPTQTVIGAAVITTKGGGSAEATTDEGAKASLDVPANAVTTDANLTITPTQTTDTSVSTQIGAVPSGKSIVGGYVYDYFIESDGQTVSTFEESVTITLTYTDDQISGLNEDSLTVYYYDESLEQWLSLNSTIDKDNNRVTAITAHFTLFALMAEEVEEEKGVVTKPISEMTVIELQAEIARISALIAQLQAQLLEMIGGTVQLSENLKYNDRGDQVKLLQTWLANDFSVYPEGIVSGWFGPLTKAAVIRFQEKYASEVLAPWKLTKGTGFVGSTTRAKLNTLYGGQ